jgi:hypothetical protein
MKRNQQLLTDLQRVDTQFQQLEIKLERLTNLKVFNILAIRTELFRTELYHTKMQIIFF